MNASLGKKAESLRSYDETIVSATQAMTILQSSQATLLHVSRREAVSLEKRRDGETTAATRRAGE